MPLKNFIPVFLHLDAKRTFTQLPHGKCLQKLNYCFSLLSPQKQSKFLLTDCLKLMTTRKDSKYDKLSMLDCLSTLEIDKYIRKTQGIPWRRRICMPSCTGCLSSIIAGSIAVCMT